jgi:hypothetical protein
MGCRGDGSRRPVSACYFKNVQTQIALRGHKGHYAVVSVALFGSSGGTSCWFLDCVNEGRWLSGTAQMARPLSLCDHPQEWPEDLRREMQTAIGQQLRVEYELPQELPPELAMLLIRMDEQPQEQRTEHHKGPSSAR